MTRDGSIKASVNVTNTGSREASEVVQLYIRDLVGSISRPVKELKDFARITLKPGETKTADIALDSEAFEYYDEAIDELSAKPGDYQILYGTSSLAKDLRSFDFTVR
jgi:beta-glucosidase